jgi:amino acid transporter
MAGWIYAFALCVSVAAVATGASPFVAQLCGLDLGPTVTTVIAVVLIAISTGLNLSGTRWLARVAMFGFICELVGALAVGAWLLIFARHRPFAALFDVSGFTDSGGHYLPAFLASSLAAMFCYYGFEACGDVAEETPDASRTIPKAMRMTIYIGGAAAMFVCLALVLSVPDLGAVVSGTDKDPVATTLRSALGEAGFRATLAIVLVSFLSCLLSLQAAASRLLYAYARDDMIAWSQRLRQLSPHTHVPAAALFVMGAAPAVIALSGLWLQDAVATIISFAAIGIYIAFQMIVLGALLARLHGWRPNGPFTLGGAGLLVNVLALAYGVTAIVNMAWPRSPQDPWYSNYGMLVATAGVVSLGLIYMLFGRPYDRGNAPAGDAGK